MKCSGENVILRGIFHVVSCFPLHLMLYRGNLDCFSNSEWCQFTGFFPTIIKRGHIKTENKCTYNVFSILQIINFVQ